MKDIHANIEEYAAASAAGMLTAAEEQAVREHAASCPSCRSALAECRKVANLLGNALGAEKPGAGFEEEIAMKVEKRIDENGKKAASPLIRRLWIPVSVAAAAIIAVGIAYSVSDLVTSGGGHSGQAGEIALMDAWAKDHKGASGACEPQPAPGTISRQETMLAFVKEKESKRRDFAEEEERIPLESPEDGRYHNTEQYDHIQDNPFVKTADDAMSTFSIDVDTASYSNVRRFLREGRLPPRGAVRIEEMINYFNYSYAPPDGRVPFAVRMEVCECPWKAGHRLLLVGIKGRVVESSRRPKANLVFLIDVSGSMDDPAKLPLLVSSMQTLTNSLDPGDRVAIVVYAGAAGLVLPSTPCERKQEILEALGNLRAGGSTQGSAGIMQAYEVARENFIAGGINRVILATDGDFNVGITNRSDLVDLVKKNAESKVFLTVLGFGTGNIKDAQLEELADKGNGNYAYIDTLKEANKVLSEQIGGTLLTIAKDVKIQMVFNEVEVEAFRLIGYENRVLRHRDFDDDRKDAGEIGAGHTVTALYEFVPAGAGDRKPEVTPSPFKTPGQPTAEAFSGAVCQLRMRYKEPEADQSIPLVFRVEDSRADITRSSNDFRWAAAVAGFGMLLRDSEHKGNSTFQQVLMLAEESVGRDQGGYRAEFLDLVRTAMRLKG